MTLREHLAGQMAALREAGTYKEELVLETPQGPRVKVNGREVVMLTSNNYLGFANHPRIREAQKRAVDRWGAGLGSVRFICGTQQLHKDLEAEIASFFGCDDAILYMTCWAANEGLFATVLDEPDGLYSDELNHASIIDGVRLC
ncbi:MAG TPA: aminotransferase class I/II-fold pyridoxal phosphate-dependent enzyme, partial [Thermoanaerobaculia bacterium]|nr:aminotransferase class I/II-fold pyridoxal phosphate-dependent enzyme [Thermoanaerobaculia bacterium]